MTRQQEREENLIDRARINQFAAHQLVFLRESRGLKQQDVSKAIKVNVAMYRMYEWGTTPMKPWVLHGLSLALDVSVADFFPKNDTAQDQLAIAKKHIKASAKHSAQALDALRIKQPKKGK